MCAINDRLDHISFEHALESTNMTNGYRAWNDSCCSIVRSAVGPFGAARLRFVADR